ncbi:MAG: hypothetical protein IPI35_24845 [Deltaproteobacteria bacterium]|nr:hypothetical protein [Deltaproteobacteria bacterium]
MKSLPAPSLLGTVGLIANLAGKVSPEQLALLAATSAAGSMAYRFYEHHVQKKQLIAQSPFSVILDVRKATRRS